jgi:hypothetical protein
MPVSKAEQILDALKALCETLPDAFVERNSVLPLGARLRRSSGRPGSARKRD